MTVDSVRLYEIAYVGGGQGRPLVAQPGIGSGGEGEKPPGPSLQKAVAAMLLTTPPHGSPCETSRQLAWPTHVAVAYAGKPASSHAPGLKDGQLPTGVPKKALTLEITPETQVRFRVTVLRSATRARGGGAWDAYCQPRAREHGAREHGGAEPGKRTMAEAAEGV